MILSKATKHQILGLIFGAVLIQLGMAYFSTGTVSFSSNTLSRLYSSKDAESVFARGQRIRLSDADVFSLELLPKVSDSLAFEILKKRKEIIKAAGRLPPLEEWKALELAHGVGEKTAKKLGQYLELD